MSSKKLRQRSCIACRRLDTREGLIRTVLIDDVVVVDLHQRMSGRGAWLHPNCFVVATERKAFNHAFKFEGEIKTKELADYLNGLGK